MSAGNVIISVLGNQHHHLQLLLLVFPAAKMCIKEVAQIQVVVVQIQA
jgi:hypothetical protein